MPSPNRISYPTSNMDRLNLNSGGNPRSDGKTSKILEQQLSSDEKPETLPILMVEDYEPIIVVASILFEFLEHSFVVARNGQEAVDKFVSGKYSIVLMDVEMPVLNGYEATNKIREYEALHKLSPITIVAMTSHLDTDIKEKCLAAGMDDYLAKPYSSLQLEILLAKYTQNENGSD